MAKIKVNEENEYLVKHFVESQLAKSPLMKGKDLPSGYYTGSNEDGSKRFVCEIQNIYIDNLNKVNFSNDQYEADLNITMSVTDKNSGDVVRNFDLTIHVKEEVEEGKFKSTLVYDHQFDEILNFNIKNQNLHDSKFLKCLEDKRLVQSFNEAKDEHLNSAKSTSVLSR
ncbi:MAG: hypothetical protein WAX04_01615 [Oscillospiraceae bacterium]